MQRIITERNIEKWLIRFTTINYLCYICFFILLILFLDSFLFHLNWLLIFLPLLPANIILFSSRLYEIIKLRRNYLYSIKIKNYCLFINTLIYIITIILLLNYLIYHKNDSLKNNQNYHKSYSFSIVFAPMYLITMITIIIRIRILPSFTSREWFTGLF